MPSCAISGSAGFSPSNVGPRHTPAHSGSKIPTFLLRKQYPLGPKYFSLSKNLPVGIAQLLLAGSWAALRPSAQTDFARASNATSPQSTSCHSLESHQGIRQKLTRPRPAQAGPPGSLAACDLFEIHCHY
jgi:hypothetical protein